MRTEINNLLKIKQINPEQKLLIMIIIENEYEPYKMPCNLTCGEMGKLLGKTRKSVLEVMWELLEMGLVTSVVENRSRDTKITALLKRMIKEEKVKKVSNNLDDKTSDVINL